MYFQINVTPKEKKAVKKTSENELEENIQQEEYTVVLAPFQPQTRVKLDTTVYKAVQCRLKVKNPSNRKLQVTVSKTAPKERFIELTALELTVEADSSADLGIVWTPQECGSWRDTLQLTDSRRVKYDVALVTTATGGKKVGVKGRSRVLGPSNSNKIVGVRERKMSPLAPRETKKNANTAGLAPSNCPSKRQRLNSTQQPQNKENITRPGWTYEKINYKENNILQSPTGHDFSAIMDSTRFNLTPLNSNVIKAIPEIQITQTNRNSFSPQGTGIISPEMANPPILRRETYTAAKYCKILSIHKEEVNEDDENFTDSLSPQPDDQSPVETSKQTIETETQSNFSVLINNMNFLTPKIGAVCSGIANFAPTDCSTVNKTRSLPQNLSPNGAISPNIPGNDTFNISATSAANISIANGTYELQISPTRSKDTIKPTRLSNTFGLTTPLTTINSGLPVTSPVCFDRLSMHSQYESTRMSISHTPRMTIYDDASVKDVLEADMWVKPEIPQGAFSLSYLKNRCSSLEQIVEERSVNETRFSSFHKTKSILTTREESSSKTRRIEISPPKKYLSSSKTAPIRRISPTKGTKIRKEKIEAPSSLRKKIQMNGSIKRGQVSIPGVRISNLSLAGLRKTKEKSSNDCKEEIVRLHDPNDFVTRFCNPDPFGATMTQDPFLTSTLYYDEKWMYHQELEFKKWLNALLTPPEHLDADVDTIRVDVGKVWQSCRAREDVALAETREVVSARYHTNTRLNTLRKAACAMFRHEEVVAALAKATVCVERGTLMIRQDRDLYRDIGLQKEILELFLSYNPLWLRIGLETVYGETIPLNSNNDLVGLTRFIITRFFSDPFIVKTYSHPTNTSVKLPTFSLHMNKFILKKFLLIVFFLDHAKRSKLIGHDPCLFHKRANHKDSRAILLTFSREVLGGVGDVTKVLRSHGYVVSHKQTFLDEYDYAVQDISTDLRDGVRLCKVMEIITGDKNLTCRCRVPAISRLQKIHNADVALSALLRCGYTLTGEIDSRSVADGHREKTLSLLWQIIYKYQAPRFEKSSKIIQKWWRAMLWYVRVRYYLRKRKNDAASKIQCAWKGFKARNELKKLREERKRKWNERESAVRVIQLRWIERNKMLKDRKSFILTREAIVKIQRWFLRIKTSDPFVQDLRRNRKAAVIIQSRWRAIVIGRRERKHYLKILTATALIHSWWRNRLIAKKVYEEFQATKKATVFVQSKWKAIIAMKIARDTFQRQLRSARTVQSWWRRYLTLKRDRNNFLLKKHAAVTITRWWEGRKLMEIARKSFEIKRKSAITIQRAWRRFSGTKNEIMRFKNSRKACKRIQQWWRSATIAKRFNLQRRSCVLIQRWWRGTILTRSAIASYTNIRCAVIVTQKNWRMKRTRSKYLAKRDAIVKIQYWYRNARISRAARRFYTAKKGASIIVQKWWRSLKITRQQRLKYLQYRETVIAIQIRWRANNLGKKTRANYLIAREAATKIQTHWRMIRQRRNYNNLLKRHRAASLLQKRWRETLEARKIRKIYVEQRSACVLIQNSFRALIITRYTRLQYLNKRKAAIVLQKNWRMFSALKAYRKLKYAVKVIQTRWRARKYCIDSRAKFLSLKKVTIDIQRRYRAIRDGRQTRKEYMRLCSAAKSVQCRWRANLKMRKENKRYIQYRKAAIVLQANWRMILQTRSYKLSRKAASTIQSKWRACVEARKVRSDYTIIKNTAIVVQRRYRANKACKIARKDYENVRKKIIWIQRAWRRKLENRMREEAAIAIQTWWRSIIEMRVSRKQYHCQKSAILVIQRRYRAYRIGEETRQEYARYIEFITRIQRRWRLVIERKRREEWLNSCGKAVKIIENWWLKILEIKRIREAELAVIRKKSAAATKIQTLWRGVRIRAKQCNVMKKLRERSKKAAEAAVPTATVAYQMRESMDQLLVCDTVGQLTMCLANLDTLTRLSLEGSVNFCKRNLVDEIYSTLDKSNRSLPWMDVCLRCTSILITLAKLPETRNYVYRIEYVEILARLMTITVDRQTDLFLHLATLIWLLAENPDYAKAITSCPRSVWLLRSLHSSQSKKWLLMVNLNKSSCRDQVIPLPNSKPDWGLSQKRPRLFTTVHHAITSLIKRLKIDEVA